MSPRTGLSIQDLLKAAIQIADEHSVGAVTLASVAKKLEIRPPSLYNHVDGLTGLRKELSKYGLKMLYETLAFSVVGKAGDDAIRALGHAYISFARKNPGLYEAVTLIPVSDDRAIQIEADKIVTLVLKVMDYYELEERMALHYVRGLRSVLHGFSSLERNGGFGIPLDLDESVQLVLETFINGLENNKERSIEK
ncbi:AcrR family transcriptional regulator [Salirhabdus euzebyi]|uniref:AcrR family transcriptional regulator n=1 Tax=Salirhabdus euzebyi TaxID=394506 RepID=A0A841Q5Q6_9BACI|nr:TetR-like C-terminal domain-containing protein [Salirhabdus euzebyi]MBB6453799.1 AcrR family transcriptional regulator [Salirhabdus euzebyi]